MNITLSIILWITYVVSLYFSVFLILVYFEKKELFKKEKQELKLNSYPYITIIIPAYNEEDSITKTLESVYNIKYPKEKLEVIIVNDGSTDNTKEKINKFIKNKNNFTLISHSNIGKAASLNIALKQTKGEYFACLDADSFVEPLTLIKQLKIFEKENDPKLSIITPAMKVYKPKNILQKIQWIEYLVIILIARITSHLDSLYVAPGPFSLYKTDTVKKIGCFDEQNITEDQEIAYRMQQNQYKIKQCPDGYVYTVAPNKLIQFYKQRRRWYLGSILCMYQYKKIIANKKYGDFGLMQMIKNLSGFLLSITGIGIAIYLILVPITRWIKNLILIDFSLIPYFSNIKLNISPLTFLMLDFKKGILILSLFFIGAFFFYQAHNNAKEKILKKGWVPIIPYFMFYYLLKGGILLVSIFEFLKEKKIKW